MLPFARGFAAVLTRPRLWGYIWKPMAWAAAAYAGLLVLAVWVIAPRMASLAPPGWLRTLVETGSGLLVLVLWLFLANFAFLALSAIFSSLLWEGFSRRVEIEIYGSAPDGRVGCGTYVVDTLLRLLFAAAVFFMSILLGWIGVFAGAAACGLLSLLDFSACAYLRRGIAFPAQLKVLSAKSALGYLIATGLLSLLPLAFIAALPALVAGGTILCRESEG
jgi:hypothetical protein